MTSVTLNKLFKSAYLHAADAFEPDHEVGDLQDLNRTAWALLSDDQRIQALESSEVEESLELGAREEFNAEDLVALVEDGQAEAVLEKLFLAADQHLEDNGDPSDAASDLQRLLEGLWAVMNTEQKQAFLKADAVAAVAEAGGCDDVTEASLQSCLRADLGLEIAQTLGFDSVETMLEHQAWLEENGSPEFKQWLDRVKKEGERNEGVRSEETKKGAPKPR